MLKIYGVPTLNSVKVVLTAEWAQLDYDYVSVNLGQAEHKTPEHLARHPLGKVPVIEHDGRALFESNAISVYLAQLSASGLYPSDAYSQGRVHQWIDMVSFHPGRWLAEHYFQYHIKPNFLGGEPEAGELEEANKFLDMQLPVVNEHLSANPWFCGAEATVADLVAFAYFSTHELSGYALDAHESLMRWYRGIRSTAAWDRTAALLKLPS